MIPEFLRKSDMDLQIAVLGREVLEEEKHYLAGCLSGRIQRMPRLIAIGSGYVVALSVIAKSPIIGLAAIPVVIGSELWAEREEKRLQKQINLIDEGLK